MILGMIAMILVTLMYEIDQIFSRFLDSILENTEDLVIRKNNGELLKSIVKQVGFQIRPYNRYIFCVHR